MLCNCGNPLVLGTELTLKRCYLCTQGIRLESVSETVVRLVRPPISEMPPGTIMAESEPARHTVKRGLSKGESVTLPESKQLANEVTGQGNRTEEKVAGQTLEVTGQSSRTETKQQRWKRKNADRVKESDRASKQRRRG